MTDERNIAEDLESIRRQLEQLEEWKAWVDGVVEGQSQRITALGSLVRSVEGRLIALEQEVQRLKNPIGYGAAPLPPPIPRMT